MPKFFDDHGTELHQGQFIGAGGEGEVHRLADRPDLAIKIYKDGMTSDQVHKIKLLSGMRQQVSGIPAAWPAGLVRDKRRQSVGLMLPVVEGGTEAHELGAPSSRRKHFPGKDWQFLAHTAANLARAVAKVHQQGLVIGDINARSFLVRQNGTVSMIDVDSFQVPVAGAKPLLCTVVQDDFRPPELDKADLRTVIRTRNHDGFGLSVLLFQVLMLGRHPYDRRDSIAAELPRVEQIAQHRFGFGTEAARAGLQPPNTIGLDALPQRVAELFEAAFAPRAAEGGRPSAGTWAAALEEMTASLVTCSRNPTHRYARHLPHCSWCEFERRVGVQPFGTVAHAARPSTAATLSLPAEGDALIRRIAAVAKPKKVTTSRTVTYVRPTAAAVLEGKAWGMQRYNGPWEQAYSYAKRELSRAQTALETANQFPVYTAARAAATKAQSDWNALKSHGHRKYQKLTSAPAAGQLSVHLRSHLIKDVDIPGIGEARRLYLDYAGIKTAADVEPGRLTAVHTFGPKLQQRLLDWRQGIERNFAGNPGRTASHDALQAISLDSSVQAALSKLRRAAAELERSSASDRENAERATLAFGDAIDIFNQARADYVEVTGKRV